MSALDPRFIKTMAENAEQTREFVEAWKARGGADARWFAMQPMAAVGHMPFAGHRNCAEWE